jgi:probable addiction module antidote protein
MAKVSPFDAAEYLDSQEAIADYLNEALETGDYEYISQAIGTIARAKGMAGVARSAGLSRENLYRALNEGGKPEFGTIMKVLGALDMQLVAKPKEDAHAA